MGKASRIEDGIVKWYFMHGGWARKIHVTGIPVANGGKIVRWRKNPKMVGSPDVIACLQGIAHRIEVKVGSDKESQHQVVDRQNFERSGGKSMVVVSLDDFLSQVQKEV